MHWEYRFKFHGDHWTFSCVQPESGREIPYKKKFKKRSTCNREAAMQTWVRNHLGVN